MSERATIAILIVAGLVELAFLSWLPIFGVVPPLTLVLGISLHRQMHWRGLLIGFLAVGYMVDSWSPVFPGMHVLLFLLCGGLLVFLKTNDTASRIVGSRLWLTALILGAIRFGFPVLPSGSAPQQSLEYIVASIVALLLALWLLAVSAQGLKRVV